MSDSQPKSVASIQVLEMSLDCPHCGAEQDGWAVDPRGKSYECDTCHGIYFVPEDVALTFPIF